MFAFRVPSVADSGYDVASGVPTATGVIFLGAHRVRLNGATIRSAGSGLDAALSHAGSGYHEHEVDQLLEQPRVRLKLTPRSIGENSGVSTVTAWVSPTSATAFTLEVAAAAVAPAAATDFTLSANRTLSFAPRSGRSTGMVTITAADDSLAAADKQVTVSASLAPATAWVVAPDAVTLEIVDDDGVPDAPANLVATAGDGTAKLRWDRPRAAANVSAHEYRQRSGSDSFADTWTTIPMSAVGGANEAGYTVGSLTNDTAYTFQVRARNAAGAGDPSNTAAATPRALTATFRTIPATHDGVHEFSVEILFSLGVSYARIRDGVQLTGGTRKRFGRVDGRADLWSYTVGPSGDADVVITLPVPADCGAADAICSGDGRPLSAALSGTVARAALADISIAPQSDRESVTEGQPARFTLTRSEPPTHPLAVAVAVTQAGTVIRTSNSYEPPASVTFRAGAQQATLTVETEADRVDEADGTISAALVAAPAYSVADAASASVEVQDDDAPRFSAAIAGPAQVDEDAGELSLTVTATTADNHAPDRGHGFPVGTQGTASGAGSERDYSFAPFRFDWTAAEFAANRAGTAYEAGATLVFRITEDSRLEGDETVIVIASRARHTFTIRDNGELPSAPRSLTAEAGFEQAVLSWTAPANAGRTPIVRYEYRVSSDGGVSWSPDWTAVPPASDGGDAGDATGYTVSGLDNDTPYTFEVRAVNTDGAGTAAQRAATPEAVNTAPVFDSGSAAFEVEENATLVGRVAATDDAPGDRVTGYAIVGGVDRAQLSIVAETGALSFTAAPDFEDPRDKLSIDPLNSSRNNEYLLVVRATSGTGARQQTADQTVLVTVTDVQEPPAAPAAPAVSAVSDTRLRVAWVEPANTGPRITGYQVRYRTSAPQGDWTEKRYSAGSRQVTITRLAGDTAYDVQVRAANDEGDGDWSPPAAARTNANALPVFTAASAAFEVGENGDRVGLVQASDPDSADRVTGSAIVGGADAAAFRLQGGRFLRFNEKPNFEAPTDALGTSPASAAGDNRYVLVVRATSGTGARERFADLDIVVTVTDSGGELPDAPAPPEVAAASATSLRVTWSPPANSGPPITDYDYRYRAAGQWIEVTDTTVPGSSATIAGLTADTSYLVQVRATNADGTSGWSFSSDGARTSANAAPAFSDVAVAFIVPENRTAVGTVVATDSDGDDVVTGYAIADGADASSFSIGESTGVLAFQSAPDYEAPADANGDNWYVVVMRATSGTGDRKQTADRTVLVRVTDVGRPHAPGAPSVAPASVTSLTVSWSAPVTPGPPITDYDYRYRVKGATASWTEATATAITATSATITGLTEGRDYEVQVRATSGEGTSDWSLAGSGDRPANQPATGQPTISGTAQVGQDLTASVSGISDGNGLTTVSYSYQWLRGETAAAAGSEISGATSATYTVVEADQGKYVRVQVSFQDDEGNDERATSDATGPVRAAAEGSPEVVPPQVTLVLAPATIAEQDDAATGTVNEARAVVTATVLPASSASFVVTVTAAADFTLSGSTLSFAASATESTGAVVIAAVDDGTDEADWEITVTGTVPAGVTAPAPVTLTIRDDDPEPVLSSAAANAEEGDDVAFEVTLSAASGKQVTVAYAAAAGPGDTAAAADFTAAAGTLTFAPGQTSHAVPVATVDDTIHEHAETFTLTLSEATNATFTGGAATLTATGTIIEDNTAPSASNRTVTMAEDTAYRFGAADFGFTDPDPGDALASVRVVTLPGRGVLALAGATANADQVMPAAELGNLTFTPGVDGNGAAYASFRFKVSDGEAESASAYTVTLAVTAVNDPPAVAFSYQVPADAFSDVDGDALSYRAARDGGSALPPWLSFEPATRTFTGTPGAADAGTVTVQVTADDGDGGTAVDQFTLTVRAPAGTDAADAEVTSRPAAGDTYRRGETIAVELTFADAVTMDLTGGEPALEIDLVGTPSKAGYTGGAGTRRLTFGYRVQTGDRDRDGVRITAVRLNGAAPQLPPQTDRGDHKVNGGLPEVSIQALAAETAEGTSAVFELRRTGTAAPELRGAIVVRDSGVAAEDRPSLSRAFLFRAGEPVRRVTVPAFDDGVVSSGRTLRAEVARSWDVYVVGDPAVATVTVTDVSQGRPAQGLPIIRGAARVGERLTALAAIRDPDGLSHAAFNWQWLADARVIAGARDAEYRPAAGDVGKRLQVRLTYVDDAGFAETLTSASTAPVAAAAVEAVAPARPASLTAVAGDGQVTLYWKGPAAPVTGYEYRRRTGGGSFGAWTSIVGSGAGGANAARWTVRGLRNGTQYGFQVRAVNAHGASGASRTALARPSPRPLSGGICERTPQVRLLIVMLLEHVHGYRGDCAGVTAAELAKLEYLGLDRQSMTGLLRGDLDGLSRLRRLDLSDNALATLPAGVFAELAVLRALDLAHNELAAFPFAELAALPRLTALRLDGNPGYGRRVAVGPAELSVRAGSAGSYRVHLTGLPGVGGVSIGVIADAAGVTAEPARLTFSSTDWFRTQAVTVSVAADAAGGRATLSHVPETFYARHPGGDVTLRIAAAAASGAAARDAAATVTGVAVAPATGEDARWRAGEQVVATVYFSAPVAVAAGGGTPTLDLTLDGERRTARYRGGTGTAALEFAHPVSEADAGAERARVVPGSLARNGATIRDAAGVDAKLAFELAPYVTAVAVAADPDGDGRWSAGEEITVWVAFSADVTVDTGEGTPTLGLLVAARQRRAAYVDGSGTRTLRFSYAVPAAAAVHAVLVEADSLTAGGGTIRAETGHHAELAHAGADRSGSPPDAEPDPEPVPGPEVAVALSVADARATEGVDATLDFVVSLERAAAAPVAVSYVTVDRTARAGEDYAAARGRLTFAAGETERTVPVAVLDDAHDEGEETLLLVLYLADGAAVAHGEATGTIENADPLPGAWLARGGGRAAARGRADAGDSGRAAAGRGGRGGGGRGAGGLRAGVGGAAAGGPAAGFAAHAGGARSGGGQLVQRGGGGRR